jgi:hypothetical protein
MSDQSSPSDKPKNQPTGDYGVGYCRPPLGTRFKKGQPSANPKGRPKKQPPEPIDPHQVLNSLVKVKDGDREIYITGTEALELQLVKAALKGKVAAIKRFLEQCEEFRIIEGEPGRNGGVVRIPHGRMDEIRKIIDEGGEWPPEAKDWINRDRPPETFEVVKRRRRRKWPDRAPTLKEIVVRLAFEEHLHVEDGRRMKLPTVTILLLILRRIAFTQITGWRLADKLLRKYGSRPDGKSGGWLVVPEDLSMEEYIRYYCECPPDFRPEEHPPGTDWRDWLIDQMKKNGQLPQDPKSDQT